MNEGCCDFAGCYERTQIPAMRELERDVLGCDYGGTSWTTLSQAHDIADSLSLAPGLQLLDVGSGSGWPGLFLGSETGCDVTLLDIPFNALKLAAERAVQDGLTDRVNVIAASGTALPFEDSSFERLSHSDVLCCLPEKLEMLQECRRVAQKGGPTGAAESGAQDYNTWHIASLSKFLSISPVASRSRIIAGLNTHPECCQ